MKIASPSAYRILDILSHGGEARFVGGCVRDALLDITSHDIDLATTHLPEATAFLLEAEGIRVIPTGIKHGTVTAVIGQQHFEITTLRRDISCDGRHAEVEYTDNWQEDASRRDFTINAMSIDRNGVLHDYFGGRQDLEQGEVAFVGSPIMRIQEDYLRILRLFRFHAYYGKGRIGEEAMRACAASIAGIDTLSGERIQQEMFKILAAPTPYYILQEMNRIGLLRCLLPGLDYPLSLDLLSSLLELPTPSSAYTRLCSIMLYNHASEASINALSQRWALSRQDKKHLHQILFPEITLDQYADEITQKRAIRMLGQKIFREVVQLAWAYDGEADNSTFAAMLALAEQWTTPNLPVRGIDLLNMGVSEGKEIGRLLKHIEDYWESNHYIPTRDELLRWAEQRILHES